MEVEHLTIKKRGNILKEDYQNQSLWYICTIYRIRTELNVKYQIIIFKNSDYCGSLLSSKIWVICHIGVVTSESKHIQAHYYTLWIENQQVPIITYNYILNHGNIIIKKEKEYTIIFWAAYYLKHRHGHHHHQKTKIKQFIIKTPKKNYHLLSYWELTRAIFWKRTFELYWWNSFWSVNSNHEAIFFSSNTLLWKMIKNVQGKPSKYHQLYKKIVTV